MSIDSNTVLEESLEVSEPASRGAARRSRRLPRRLAAVALGLGALVGALAVTQGTEQPKAEAYSMCDFALTYDAYATDWNNWGFQYYVANCV